MSAPPTHQAVLDALPAGEANAVSVMDVSELVFGKSRESWDYRTNVRNRLYDLEEQGVAVCTDRPQRWYRVGPASAAALRATDWHDQVPYCPFCRSFPEVDDHGLCPNDTEMMHRHGTDYQPDIEGLYQKIEVPGRDLRPDDFVSWGPHGESGIVSHSDNEDDTSPLVVRSGDQYGNLDELDVGPNEMYSVFRPVKS